MREAETGRLVVVCDCFINQRDNSGAMKVLLWFALHVIVITASIQ